METLGSKWNDRVQMVTGIFAVVTVLLSLAMIVWLSPYKFEHDFQDDISSPVLALELARNAGDLRAVLQTSHPAKASVAHAVLYENNMLDMIYIPLYIGFLASFTFLTKNGNSIRNKRAHLGCVMLIFGCGVADYLEDFGIAKALGGVPTDSLAAGIRTPSLVKWALFGIALTVIGVRVLALGTTAYSLATNRLMGAGYLFSGLLVILGLPYPSWIELGVRLFGVLVIWNTIGLVGPLVRSRFPGLISYDVSAAE